MWNAGGSDGIKSSGRHRSRSLLAFTGRRKHGDHCTYPVLLRYSACSSAYILELYM